MVCIYCGKNTQIINSRHQKKHNQKWRRRFCKNCGATVTSVESIDLTTSLRFKNSLGKLEPFYRDKLFISVHDACKHRKTAHADSTALTATIISKILSLANKSIIDSASVIDITSLTLSRFDKTAGTVYLAFHSTETKNS